MVKIIPNDYDISKDKEVEEVADKVQKLFAAGHDEIMINPDCGGSGRLVQCKKMHIAEEVGRRFVHAGYFASTYHYPATGYWGYVTISKQPQDLSFSMRPL